MLVVVGWWLWLWWWLWWWCVLVVDLVGDGKEAPGLTLGEQGEMARRRLARPKGRRGRWQGGAWPDPRGAGGDGKEAPGLTLGAQGRMVSRHLA